MAESVDVSDADENERLDQFGEERNQEEESQIEQETSLDENNMVESVDVSDELHIVEEIEEQPKSTGPVHCWKKRLQPRKKHLRRAK